MPARNLVAVVLWMTGALLSFCAMAVSVRVLAGTLSVMEILALRAGLGLAVMASLAATRADLRATINSAAPAAAPVSQRRSRWIVVSVGDEPPAHPVGDDLRAGVHHAGVDAAARRAGIGRTAHREPGRRRGVRPIRRAGDPASRPNGVSAGRVAGVDGGVRVCGHAGGYQKAHAHGQPVCDHLLDDADPVAARVDHLRSAVPA